MDEDTINPSKEIIDLYRYLDCLLSECGYFKGYEYVSTGRPRRGGYNDDFPSWARWYKAAAPHLQIDRLELVIEHSYVTATFNAQRHRALSESRTVVSPAGAHAASLRLEFALTDARGWSPDDVADIENTFCGLFNLVSQKPMPTTQCNRQLFPELNGG